jgi:hypothetical protein
MAMAKIIIIVLVPDGATTFGKLTFSLTALIIMTLSISLKNVTPQMH